MFEGCERWKGVRDQGSVDIYSSGCGIMWCLWWWRWWWWCCCSSCGWWWWWWWWPVRRRWWFEMGSISCSLLLAEDSSSSASATSVSISASSSELWWCLWWLGRGWLSVSLVSSSSWLSMVGESDVVDSMPVNAALLGSLGELQSLFRELLPLNLRSSRGFLKGFKKNI